MNRNVWTLIVVSALFGLAFGVYELALPLYLKSRGISMVSMGIIFAVPAVCTFVIRIGFGSLSDFFDRKPFYTGSIALVTLACALTPLNAIVWMQVVTKCIHQAAMELRKTIHAVLLYETAESKFIDNIGKTTGVEFLLMGVGAVVAGYWMRSGQRVGAASEATVFWLCVGMLAVCALVFASFFHEDTALRQPPKRSALKEILAVDLDKQLWIMMASMFVFNIGLSCSHCQVMPLFFRDKFHFGNAAIGWIMAGHRFTIALPLMLVGCIVKRPHKSLYVGLVFAEGVVLAASGFVPAAGMATAVWLLHDLVGAGIWSPTQTTLMQMFAKSESRGTEVSKVMAMSYLGFIIGPPLAGWLYGMSVSLPFIVGGCFMAASAALLLPLRVDSADGH